MVWQPGSFVYFFRTNDKNGEKAAKRCMHLNKGFGSGLDGRFKSHRAIQYCVGQVVLLQIPINALHRAILQMDPLRLITAVEISRRVWVLS